VEIFPRGSGPRASGSRAAPGRAACPAPSACACPSGDAWKPDGLLLAAASLAVSFLGREAFDRDPKRGLALHAVVTFVLAVGASVYILLPKRDKFVFALVGAGLYEGLYAVRQDLGEVYRRLAYDLDRFWDDNDAELQKLFASFRVAAAALSAEILVLIAMVSDNLF
jgi:hypothetical protein